MDHPHCDLQVPACLGRYIMPLKPFSHMIFWWQNKCLQRATNHLRWRIRNKPRILAARKAKNPSKTMIISLADDARKAVLREMKARHMRAWRAKKAAQRNRLRSSSS